MELDKEILEKICYDVYNSEYLLKNEHPTPVKLVVQLGTHRSR